MYFDQLSFHQIIGCLITCTLRSRRRLRATCSDLNSCSYYTWKVLWKKFFKIHFKSPFTRTLELCRILEDWKQKRYWVYFDFRSVISNCLPQVVCDGFELSGTMKHSVHGVRACSNIKNVKAPYFKSAHYLQVLWMTSFIYFSIIK